MNKMITLNSPDIATMGNSNTLKISHVETSSFCHSVHIQHLQASRHLTSSIYTAHGEVTAIPWLQIHPCAYSLIHIST